MTKTAKPFEAIMFTHLFEKDNAMTRIVCPRCEKSMSAISRPAKLKHVVPNKETIATNYAICRHCGATAKSVIHVILNEQAIQTDWLTA